MTRVVFVTNFDYVSMQWVAPPAATSCIDEGPGLERLDRPRALKPRLFLPHLVTMVLILPVCLTAFPLAAGEGLTASEQGFGVEVEGVKKGGSIVPPRSSILAGGVEERKSESVALPGFITVGWKGGPWGHDWVEWGRMGPSPYYVPDGLQSPFRETGLHLGGDTWIDTGYEDRRRGLESQPDMRFWLMQGRFMLDATATWTRKGFFAQTKAQLLAHIEEIPGAEHIDTDDAWVRFGVWDSWDVQVGRFEAWEVYRKGEGLERDTLEDEGAFDGPDIYEVNYAFYRQDGFGQAALHLYPADWLRFELSSVFGNELGFNSLGGRGTMIVDLGALKVKTAAEYRKLENQEEGKKQWEKKRGVGAGLSLNLEELGSPVPVEFGVNSGYGIVDRVDAFGKVDEKGSPDTFSAGGFLNLGIGSAVVGLGYNHTLQGDRQLNDRTGRVGHFVHKQGFVSVRHPLFYPWLTAKIVGAWAEADLEPAFDNPRVNDMYSVRLRLLMVF